MNKQIRIFIGLITVLMLSQLCMLAASTAQAQDFLMPRKEEKQGPSAEEIYKQLPPDEQERLIAEATEVHDYCNRQSMFANFHDCRCLSAEFWSERVINYDPNLNPITVADRLASKCPNEPGVAGYAYKRCNSYYAQAMRFGLEEFCTCYANTFAKLYMQDPRAHMPNVTNIASRSTLECSDKGLPSPMPGSKNPAR